MTAVGFIVAKPNGRLEFKSIWLKNKFVLSKICHHGAKMSPWSFVSFQQIPIQEAIKLRWAIQGTSFKTVNQNRMNLGMLMRDDEWIKSTHLLLQAYQDSLNLLLISISVYQDSINPLIILLSAYQDSINPLIILLSAYQDSINPLIILLSAYQDSINPLIILLSAYQDSLNLLIISYQHTKIHEIHSSSLISIPRFIKSTHHLLSAYQDSLNPLIISYQLTKIHLIHSSSLISIPRFIKSTHHLNISIPKLI